MPSDPSPPQQVRFNRIVEENVDAAWRVARRCGVPRDQLDDVLQEVFLVVSRRLRDISSAGERAFVVGTTVRVSANYRRTLRRRLEDSLPELDDTSNTPSPERAAMYRQALDLLDNALAQLTDMQREVFILTELEQLTAREVSEHLQIPEAAVVSRLRRARGSFKQFCQQHDQVLASGLPANRGAPYNA